MCFKAVYAASSSSTAKTKSRDGVIIFRSVSQQSRAATAIASWRRAGGNDDNVQFEIDDFFIELNLALQCNARSIKHIGNRLRCRRNQWGNFCHYRHNFVFFTRGEINIFSCFSAQASPFIFILIGWHKNYHFHKLQAIIVTRCFTSQFTCSIVLRSSFLVFDFDDDFLRGPIRSSSLCHRAFVFGRFRCCWWKFQVSQLVVG